MKFESLLSVAVMLRRKSTFIVALMRTLNFTFFFGLMFWFSCVFNTLVTPASLLPLLLNKEKANL